MTARPTLLIAYGAYGRAAVKRLLVAAALRGRLRWSRGGGEERRLLDLAAIHLPDDPGRGEAPDLDIGSASLELMRDLDHQILTLPPGEMETTFSMLVDKESARLLSSAQRLRRDDALPLGLDVIVLARPDRPEVVGRLDRLLGPVLESLGAKKVLGRGPGGSERLSFLQILDFEDYWHPGPTARRAREALSASASRWHRRARAKEPAFGRIFLIDGQTSTGVKFAKDRMDETVLFLELLLFEGLRSGSLQRLYQRRRDEESPICTFGIRVFERSSGLLSRLAAAEFAVQWLTFLDSSEPALETHSAVDQFADPLRGNGLSRILGLDDLHGWLDPTFDELCDELLQIPPRNTDWPQRIEQACAGSFAALERRLDAELHHLMSKHPARPADLVTHLAQAADHDLGALPEGEGGRNPKPLSAQVLLDTLKRLRSDLAPDAVSTSSTASPSPSSGTDAVALSQDAAELQQDYAAFLSNQVDSDRLRSFWPLWAISVAVAVSPGLVDLWRRLPVPNPNDFHPLWVGAYQLVDGLVSPATAAVLAGAVALAVGLGVSQPRLERAAERGRRFFVDPERGRFSELVRRESGPNGRLRAPLVQMVEGAAADRVAGARGRLVREIDQLCRRLKERRREMAWLRNQLVELLRIHGLTMGGSDCDNTPLRHGSGVRHAAETRGDLQRLVATNPPSPERFRSMQSTERPMVGWREAEAGMFLRPLDFLDRLSRRFRSPEAESRGPRAGELATFLDRHHDLDLSFAWHASDEVPSDERLCMAPRALLLESGTGLRLSEHGMAEEARHELADPDRVYLMRLQLGVPAERLLGRAAR